MRLQRFPDLPRLDACGRDARDRRQLRRREHLRRQILGLDGLPAPDRDGVLDRVFEFAHVARPGVAKEGADGVGGEAQLAPVPRGDAHEEEARQRLDVLAAHAQRRDLDRHDAEAVVEVLAETPLDDGAAEVDVRRGHDADVGLARVAVADALEGPLLEEAEEFDLERRRKVADLVEEERAARRELDAAEAVAHGAGERAAHVAEQLALEELARQRRAVHGDEAAPFARGVGVDGVREDFLPGAALAGEEDGGVAGLEVVDEVEEPGHGRGARDHAGEAGRRRGAGRRILFGGAHDDDVGHARVADALVVGLERRGAAGDEARAAVGKGHGGAPPLAALAALEDVAQGAVEGEELAAEELGDRTAVHDRRPGGMHDPEIAIEADQAAAERLHDGADGDEGRGALLAFGHGVASFGRARTLVGDGACI